MATSTERYVIYPSEVRLNRLDLTPHGLPRSFTLGALPHDALLLSFTVDAAATNIERAFIVLYPTQGTAGNPGTLALSLEWQSEPGLPPASMPTSRAFSRGDNPVRFDVTSALRTELQTPGDTHRAIISIDSGEGTQTFDLLGPGTSPRLELYARRTRGSGAAQP